MRLKVFKLLLFIAILLSSLLLSCNSNTKSMFKADNGVEFNTINFEKEHFLDNNPENPSCNLTLNLVYPNSIANFDSQTAKRVFLRTVIGADYDSLSAQEAVDKYAQNYINNYQSDAEIYKINKPTQKQSNDDLYLTEDDQAYLPEIFYSYYENISDSIVYNQYGIISFKVKQTNNKGGRMSYETNRNYVLDLSNGELITESDIFSAGYDMALRPIIQNSLMEANNVKSIQELEDLGFFGIDEILPNKNFLITDKGIIYTFNKGEYSAYQLQAPEIFIPYGVIRSLLREGSIAFKLSKL
ncbi:MAG: RsiV family protein [Bacteroidia bacterium]|nr:RsiV family protein [Bacteroidia bacterium]